MIRINLLPADLRRGTFGGPVWIPKLYNGKQKTFFFVSFDGTRNQVFVFGGAMYAYSSNLFAQSDAVADSSITASVGMELKRRAGIISVDSSVRVIRSSTWASVISRGAPGRGSSARPSSRAVRKRWSRDSIATGTPRRRRPAAAPI